MHQWKAVLAVSAVVLTAQPAAFAWNSTGHRIVAYIAYQQLDDGTKQRVVAALKQHPAVGTDLWTNGGVNGDDKDLNLFLNAATFPDDVRHSEGPNRFHDPMFNPYHKRPNHFVDYQLKPPAKTPGEPAPGDTLLNTYRANVALVKDPNADDAAQAVALSWIFHQIGDVHQPMHCVSRFAGKLENVTDGDGGGNGVTPFPNPRGHHDLHSFWDDLVGSSSQGNNPAKLQRLANGVMKAFPPTDFKPGELKGADDLTPWAQNSFRLAVEKSYEPLGDDLDSDISEDDEPANYEDTAKQVAQRQVALAGYRLASQLKALFPPN